LTDTLELDSPAANRTSSAVDDGTVVVRRAWGELARMRGRLIEVVVLVVALAARLGVILRDGGIHGIIGYDATSPWSIHPGSPCC
jgi:hypothetical protein